MGSTAVASSAPLLPSSSEITSARRFVRQQYCSAINPHNWVKDKAVPMYISGADQAALCQRPPPFGRYNLRHAPANLAVASDD